MGAHNYWSVDKRLDGTVRYMKEPSTCHGGNFTVGIKIIFSSIYVYIT
ncbi:hypothetical protein RSAG8_13799, partial [Rhizoctonia solani AG-8 WAC10335]